MQTSSTATQDSKEISTAATVNLDSLMKELNEDDLRNIAGGQQDRPKGSPDDQ